MMARESYDTPLKETVAYRYEMGVVCRLIWGLLDEGEFLLLTAEHVVAESVSNHSCNSSLKAS